MIVNLKKWRKNELEELKKEIASLKQQVEWLKHNYDSLLKQILK